MTLGEERVSAREEEMVRERGSEGDQGGEWERRLREGEEGMGS